MFNCSTACSKSFCSLPVGIVSRLGVAAATVLCGVAFCCGTGVDIWEGVSFLTEIGVLGGTVTFGLIGVCCGVFGVAASGSDCKVFLIGVTGSDCKVFLIGVTGADCKVFLIGVTGADVDA